MTVRRGAGSRCGRRCRNLVIADRLRRPGLIAMIAATTRDKPLAGRLNTGVERSLAVRRYLG